MPFVKKYGYIIIAQLGYPGHSSDLGICNILKEGKGPGLET